MTDLKQVTLAAPGTPLAVFQKERTDAISEMFDNVNEYGIYPTGKFFARLDNCVSSLIDSVRSSTLEEVESALPKYKTIPPPPWSTGHDTAYNNHDAGYNNGISACRAEIIALRTPQSPTGE